MTGPPDASHPFGASSPGIWVLAALGGFWAIGLAVWAWAWTGAGLPGAWWLSATAGSLCLLWCGWGLRSRRQGNLVWMAGAPGRHPGGWSLLVRHGGRAVPVTRIECVLDLQQALLLRVHPRSGPPAWIWLLRRDDPQGWAMMRRAVFATGGR